MKLFILFGHRQEEYDGQFAPEALVCWDEFCVEENPDGFEEECAKYLKKTEGEFAATRVIQVEVDGEEIIRHLTGTPTIEGAVTS